MSSEKALLVCIFGPSHSHVFFILLQVASESIKIYQAISDGTVNLVDKVRIDLIARQA